MFNAGMYDVMHSLGRENVFDVLKFRPDFDVYLSIKEQLDSFHQHQHQNSNILKTFFPDKHFLFALFNRTYFSYKYMLLFVIHVYVFVSRFLK